MLMSEMGIGVLPNPLFGGKRPIVLMQGESTNGHGGGSAESSSGSQQESATAARVGRLSKGQLDALLLVDQHLNSKEIAAELGISPHTVDQRIRGALHTLGVERRSQAARLVAQVHAPYQRLIHQTPHIEGGGSQGHPGGAVGFQIRHADRAGGARNLGIVTEQRPGSSWSSLPLPFATRSHPRNEMSVGLRLVWIVLIAMGATFSAGMYLAGLESLARMLGR
jgi:DNA-binding CsgD family transcriptional regulator